jgi:uncharacterized protein YgiM (DUF1202 family)
MKVQDVLKGRRLMNKWKTLFLITFILVSSCSSATAIESSESLDPTTTSSAPTHAPLPVVTATFADDENNGNRNGIRATFSITDAHHTTPEDVLREVEFSVTGGPGFMCDQLYEAPTMISQNGQLELMDTLSVHSCGWQPDETVYATLAFPTGEEIVQEAYTVINMQTEEAVYRLASFSYQIAVDDPTGFYTITLTAGSGEVQQSFYVQSPTEPKLIAGSNELRLFALKPEEHFRLFAYDVVGDEWDVSRQAFGILAGWQDFQADSNGQIAIQTNVTDYIYVAIGEESGIVYQPLEMARLGDVLATTYLEINSAGTVLDIREGPGHEYRVVDQFSQDTQLRVVGQPREVSGDTWWPVQLNDGTMGWVIQMNVRMLTPTPSALATQSTLAPSEEDTSSCPGAPPQRVRLGDRVQVCTAYDRLVVRNAPDRSSTEVARLDPGTSLTIIDGPSCANNWSWWKIQADSNVAGWVSEGGDDVDPYFICPEE